MLKISKKMQERLGKLGFKKLSTEIESFITLKQKMVYAYHNYIPVTQDKIDKFNKELESNKVGGNYKKLVFVDVCNYDKVPPEDVLVSLEKAKEGNCFDKFEIALIREIKDPVLFGVINGCTDRFFIAQWDDDVSLDDILVADIKSIKVTRASYECETEEDNKKCSK